MISKKLFLKTLNTYKVSKISKFTYKYFSSETKQKDYWISKILKYVFLILITLGMLGTAFKIPYHYIEIFFYSLLFLFLSLFFVVFLGVISKNIRINKICKKLNISKKEYNYYLLKFKVSD